MKKIAKLSLVAAVAVAGLTTANAQPLEEAIKNVEVSGSVVYRYNDYNNDSKTTNDSTTNNNYKVAANLSSKVNEDVKFNSRFLVGNDQGNFAGPLDTQDGSDSNVDVELSNAYFGYTGIANTTVNVGKQGLTTPWTVAIDSDGNEQTGTGILALSTVGPVTLAAAYFNQTNLDKSTDASHNGVKLFDTARKAGDPLYGSDSALAGSANVATVGAIANLDVVTLDAWYLDLTDTFDTYTIGAKSDLDLSGVKLGIDARYAALTLDKPVANLLNGGEDNNAMAKIALTAKAGIVNGKLAYAMTDKDGGLTALDNDANTTLLGWTLTSNGKTDADYWQAVVGVDILSNLNLSANYGNIEYKESNVSGADKMEEEEIYAQLTYKMSKNLSTYVRYGTYEKENVTTNTESNDDVRGRLQVEYTF
ncbi:MAG: major outer membrane protein [Aliarcobacter sp.]|nr:major outer membrane protein [Aliarcobacter sp.]